MAAPAPSVRSCPACGAEAHRRFGGALLRGVSGPAAKAPVETPPLCQTNPSVPGLCHMIPSAARSWAARARGDNRTLERELARQESSLSSGNPVASPVSHDHSPGHTHGHGHSHSHSKATDAAGMGQAAVQGTSR